MVKLVDIGTMCSKTHMAKIAIIFHVSTVKFVFAFLINKALVCEMSLHLLLSCT